MPEYRNCPGTNTIAYNPGMDWRAWCPFCGHTLRVRNDGSLPRHRLRYAEFVEQMSALVAVTVGMYEWGSSLGRSPDRKGSHWITVSNA